MTNTTRRLVKINQYDNKSLIDPVKIFQHARDVVESQLVTEFLDIFVRNQEEYPTFTKYTDQAQLKKVAFKKCTTFLLMKVSYQYKYVALLK